MIVKTLSPRVPADRVDCWEAYYKCVDSAPLLLDSEGVGMYTRRGANTI